MIQTKLKRTSPTPTDGSELQYTRAFLGVGESYCQYDIQLIQDNPARRSLHPREIAGCSDACHFSFSSLSEAPAGAGSSVRARRQSSIQVLLHCVTALFILTCLSSLEYSYHMLMYETDLCCAAIEPHCGRASRSHRCTSI